MWPPEKSQDSGPFVVEWSIFSSPVFGRNIAKYGHLSRISGERGRTFSAFQTAWRRERDSNPRYPLRYTRFRGARLQPLGHLSAPTSFIFILSGKLMASNFPAHLGVVQADGGQTVLFDIPSRSGRSIARCAVVNATTCEARPSLLRSCSPGYP